MSSCSIARQNRRKRLRQNSYVPHNGESDVILHTAVKHKLTPGDDEKENFDVISKACCEGLNSDDVKAKASFSSESEPYEALSFATSCSFIRGDVLSRPVEKIFIEGESK